MKRFGFVTTNSLSQTFQRRVVAKRLNGDPPLRLLHAIPDHPWTGAAKGAAAVRVAMTVAAAGSGDGVRYDLSDDGRGDGDPHPVFTRRRGRLNGGLTIGPDPDSVEPLLANQGLCSPGVKLHGAGFIVSPAQARDLGLGGRPGLEAHIRPYRNGRDVVQAGRGVLVIDLYPLPAREVRDRFPEIYEHLLATVKPHRDANRIAFRHENWWWFGATHALYRSFTADLPRHICTPETAKHRLFTVLPAGVRADNMLVNIGLEDGFHLGVLSSDVHTRWALAVGAVLEDRPRYTKSAFFDPFPFPDPPPGLRQAIARTAEDMLAVRRAVQAEHPELTLTAIYNAVASGSVDARTRTGALRELHAQLNALVRAAYNWEEGLCGSDLVSALIALNLERRAEERAGKVRWLRPDYQCARFKTASRPPIVAPGDPMGLIAPAERLIFPNRMEEQSVAVLEVLAASVAPLSVGEVAARFQTSGRRRIRAQVEAALPSLLAYGHLSRMADGRFVARRVA